MSDNPHGFTDDEMKAIQKMEWRLREMGVDGDELARAVANFWLAATDFGQALIDWFNTPDIQEALQSMIAVYAPIVDAMKAGVIFTIGGDTLTENSPRQRAYARSKRDVQRKRRGGKYRWGGQGDE